MPLRNFHSCDLRPDTDFEQKSFRVMVKDRLQILIGRLKGKTTTTTAAIRYPIGSWTAEAARADCREKGGTFVAASPQGQEMDYLDPAQNPMIRTEEEE